MKVNFIIILFIYFSNLAFSQVKQDTCMENVKFKKYFSENILIVENNEKYGRKVISKALRELNKYVEIAGFEKANYSGITYGDAIVFNEYKKKWMEWYEQNKCRNLKKHRKKFYRPLKEFEKNYDIH